MAEMSVEAIAARLAAATPGPWEPQLEANDDGHLVMYAVRIPRGLASIPGFVEFDAHVLDPDGELIANAPADIAFLLGEVERARDLAAAAAELAASYRDALESIAEHPCPSRDCCCGPAPDFHSMGRIARTALGMPEPFAEEVG